jgi:SAM-dependent methyltransferase
MADPDVSAARRDVVWQQDGAVANYLATSRQAIPLASEQIDAMLRVIDAYGIPTRTVLDVGAGDGAAAHAVAQRFPVERVTLVDFSQPMLKQALHRFAGATHLTDIVEADLIDGGWLSELPADVPAYDLVVSRYAIHHLPHERKSQLYREAFDRLAPGGLFFNIEHVSSVSPVSTEIFERLIIEGMVATSDAGLDIERATAAFRARQDAQTNILAPVYDQVGWLRDIGFVDVDVIMKVFELAVIVARRPDGTEP